MDRAQQTVITFSDTLVFDALTKLADPMRIRLEEHLAKQDPARSNYGEIRVFVDNIKLRKGSVEAKVSVSCGGGACRETFTHRSRSGNVVEQNEGAADVAGLGGAMLFGLTGARGMQGIVRAINTEVDQFASLPAVKDCLLEAVDDICVWIDSLTVTGGHLQARTTHSSRWETVSKIRLVLGAIGLIVGIVAVSHNYLTAEEPPTSLPFCILIHGLYIAVITGGLFGFAHFFGIMVMPKKFLLHDPKGRKAMTQFGLNSVLGMRVVAFIGGLMLLGIAIIATLLLAFGGN